MRRLLLLSALLGVVLGGSLALEKANAASVDPCRPATFCEHFTFAVTEREPLDVYWPATETVATDEQLTVYVDQTTANIVGSNTVITAGPPSCRDTQFSCRAAEVAASQGYEAWQVHVWMVRPGPSTPPDLDTIDGTWQWVPLWVQYGAITDPSFQIVPWTVPGYGLANCQVRVDPSAQLPYTDSDRDEVVCRLEPAGSSQWPDRFFLHMRIQPKNCMESNPEITSHLIRTI